MKRLILVIIVPFLFASSLNSDHNGNSKWVSNDPIDSVIDSMTLEEKIGQFFMVAAYSNKDSSHSKVLRNLIHDSHIGGLIFFQGEAQKMQEMIEGFQKDSKIPLLIGMDAEWGTAMRLFGEERFPYQYTMGAADDIKLTNKISMMIAADCLEKGVHINFAPVADVNSNPDNPVIGFRSFGSESQLVARHVGSFVMGHEQQGLLSCVKHFPGHGDTYLDSHLELPVIRNTVEYIDSIDGLPFEEGFKQGASSVMIAHLSVPSIDSTGLPATLSSTIIQDHLIKKYNYKGLIISDALNMKAVADRYGKAEVAVRAFEAGCDILLYPEDVKLAVQLIADKVRSGEISMEEIDRRLKKILKVKNEVFSENESWYHFHEDEIVATKKLVYEKSITVLKNDDVLPIPSFDKKIACISLGPHTESLIESMQLIADVDHFHAFTGAEAIQKYADIIKEYDLIITSVHSNSLRSKNDYGYPAEWRKWVKHIPLEMDHILLLAGNPLVLKNDDVSSDVDALVVSYENHELALDRLGQFVMGAFESKGTLPISINDVWSAGYGVHVEWGGRLKYGSPYEFGISSEKLAQIDTAINRSIADGVFPGCQIVAAYDGVIIYRKSFGFQTYDSLIPITDNNIYDLASVTKIAASTASLMNLESKELFSLDNSLGDYLNELTDSTAYDRMKIKSMMAHQAGLYPWIPFYLKTLTNGLPDSSVYLDHKEGVYANRVTEHLWMDTNYVDVMYQRILETKVSGSSYKYSDLGYYFMKKIIEQQGGFPLEEFVQKTFYKPLGLRTMGYNPVDRFSLDIISPTEDDHAFRQELIHGYVHDQGAAMMGGVCGHAGLFSNATDLASMMQLFLNKGQVGGVSYFTQEVADKYTGCQFCPKNRRGAGFDKPVRSLEGGPTCGLVSLSSFGHSGFTGTYAWADPEYKINYVFLSNRVYPDAENWKIVKTGIRTEVQRIIYEAVREAQHNK